MKKWITLALCVAMVATLLIMPTFAETAQEEGAEPLRVALCVSNTLGDRGFFDSANEGLKRLEETYGVKGSVVECKSDASLYYVTLVDAAEANDLVVAVGWEFWDALGAVAPKMPDTQFLFIDNDLDGVGDNLMSITYAENQGSFLAGYIAMKQSKAAKVGVVAADESDTIQNFVVGYKQGALHANPEGIVLEAYTDGDYEAPDKGKEAALALYSQGADVVFQVAGKTGLGVFEAAGETGNFAVGVDSDQKYLNPDVILCSMIKDVGGSIYDVVSGMLGGESHSAFQGGKIWNADMTTGFVGISYGDDTMTQQISQELKAEVEALQEQIINGEIVVETTRGL